MQDLPTHQVICFYCDRQLTWDTALLASHGRVSCLELLHGDPMTDLLFWFAMMALLILTATVSYFAYVVWATEKHHNEVPRQRVA